MDLFLSACWNYGSVPLKCFRLLELWICSFKIFPLAGTLLELFICSFKIVLLAGTSPKKFGNFLLFTERVPLDLNLNHASRCLQVNKQYNFLKFHTQSLENNSFTYFTVRKNFQFFIEIRVPSDFHFSWKNDLFLDIRTLRGARILY